MEVGGGAINEKKRTFQQPNGTFGFSEKEKPSSTPGQPSPFDPSNRCHLMHALEGLDRYPNYLSRWSLEDCEKLEQGLEQRLQQVKAQKQQTLERRKGLRRVVDHLCREEPEWATFLQPPESWEDVQSAILHTKASKAVFRSNFFRRNSTNTFPTVEDVISGKATVELDAGNLEQLIDEEVYDVYSFLLLSPSFCSKLQRFIKAVMDKLESMPEFETLNRIMIRDLDNLGLGWINDLLLHLIVRPISRHLYKETEIHGELDWRQGFVAAYSASPTQSKPRQRLVPHTDDAEVTLNVCIGDIFEGGTLQLWGLRGTADAGTSAGEYRPEVGRALLHAGRQLHEVTEITSGNRFAYIMWTRSWTGTRAGSCPCCWLNRREDKNCICGSRWN